MNIIKYLMIISILLFTLNSCGNTIEDDIKEIAEIDFEMKKNAALFLKGELSGNEVKKLNKELEEKAKKLSEEMKEKAKDKTDEEKAKYKILLEEEMEKLKKEAKEEMKENK